MCIGFGVSTEVTEMEDALDHLRIPLVLPMRRALAPKRDLASPGDSADVIRPIGRSQLAELSTLRWSWPGLRGKPVSTFRAEGLRFTHGRCLTPATHLVMSRTADGRGRVRVELADAPWFCMAGFWRRAPGHGDAFALLTLPARGPVSDLGARQAVILDRSDWAGWLDDANDARDSLRPVDPARLRLTELDPPRRPRSHPDARNLEANRLLDNSG